MPTGVNLLDWRAERRRRAQRRFIRGLISAGGVGLVTTLLIAQHVDGQVQAHAQRQAALQATIAGNADAMDELQRLRASIEAARTRLATIKTLTAGREQPLQTLIAAMTTLPPGITVRRLALTDKHLVISGETRRPGQLAAYLSALEDTTAFKTARMTALEATADRAPPRSQFEIEAMPAWP